MLTPSATVSIVDNDAAPELSSANISVGEGDGQAVVTLSLSAPSGFEVQVQYGTVDGTAVAGEDYTATSGTAVIPVGEGSTEVPITILNDGIDETDEAFTLELWDPVNTGLVTPEVIITITDDDLPDLPFSDGFESGDTSAWSVTVP